MINIIKDISNRRHTQKITPGPEKVLTMQKPARILKKIQNIEFHKIWVSSEKVINQNMQWGGGARPPLQSDKG